MKIIKTGLVFGLILLLVASCSDGSQRRYSDDEIAVIKDSVLFYKGQGKDYRKSGLYKEAIASHERGLQLA